ncbi:MAG: EAL domain-containing protein [Proteobacteria bacterium]|nr:EAL domain-containing protein [Pseudomonadota bacterium]
MNAKADPELARIPQPRNHRRRALIESFSLVATMLLAVAAGVGGVWLGSKAAITANFRHYLTGLAQTAATLVDPELHELLRRPEQLNDAQYTRAVGPLRRMRKAVPDIHYLYTLVRDGSEVRFVLDAAEPGAKTATGSADQSGVWETYSHESPALQQALGRQGEPGQVASDEAPTSDEWGTFMTGLAPLRDRAGHQIGVIGVDVDASNYLGRLMRARERLLLGLLPAGALTVIFGCVFYRVRLRGLLDAHTAYSSEQAARQAAERLAADAQKDRLTQLATRGVLIERLEASLTRVRQHQQPCLAVLFLDFDRFKLLNDSLGHEAGDELLRCIAERLRSSLRYRDSDTADTRGNIVCRFGGDEFIVLLNDLNEPADALTIAQRLLNSLAQAYKIFGTEVQSSASIGIVTSHDGNLTASETIRNADVAMYEAKRAGRGCSVVFDETMQARLQRQTALERELRGAIGTEQLYLEYQPVVDLSSGRQVYVEALLRWRHSTLGLISVDEFMPIVEEHGLSAALGQWTRESACRSLARIGESGPASVPQVVSLKLSQAELAMGLALLDQVTSALQACNLAPSRLQLEISERDVMRDPTSVVKFLREFQARGVRLAMHEFGSGLSSWSWLRGSPFNTIKIDRSLLRDLGTSREVLSVMQAAIHLIENLGMMSVAEGVENPLQVSMLQSLGCRCAQGEHFGRSLSAADVAERRSHG